MADFAEVRRQTSSLDELTRDAYVDEVLVVPMGAGAAMGLKRMAATNGDDWVYVVRIEKLWLYRPSNLGRRNPVVFPPLHTQLVGWWLFMPGGPVMLEA